MIMQTQSPSSGRTLGYVHWDTYTGIRTLHATTTTRGSHTAEKLNYLERGWPHMNVRTVEYDLHGTLSMEEVIQVIIDSPHDRNRR